MVLISKQKDQKEAKRQRKRRTNVFKQVHENEGKSNDCWITWRSKWKGCGSLWTWSRGIPSRRWFGWYRLWRRWLRGSRLNCLLTNMAKFWKAPPCGSDKIAFFLNIQLHRRILRFFVLQTCSTRCPLQFDILIFK